MPTPLEAVFPCCHAQLTSSQRSSFTQQLTSAKDFPEALDAARSTTAFPAYLPDLARLELAWSNCFAATADTPPPFGELCLNPTLNLVEVAWSGLLSLLDGVSAAVQPGNEFILIWKHPGNGRCRRMVATAEDLLALKLVAEKLDLDRVATAEGQPIGVLDRSLEKAVHKGLVQQPESRLRRPADDLQEIPERFLAAPAFTLQWHITQRCDLNCLHCYDRSDRQDVSLAQGLETLDQMRAFCRSHYVSGQVSFSGGNPFLHSDFPALYQAAVDRNLTPAILGNPVSADLLDPLLDIAKPVFYQVSLEGLEKHNDRIRGPGSFAAVIDFLERLKSRKVFSMVMLTLTRDNLDQVLPLAEELRDRVDLFTYNRLSTVGQGAALETAERSRYQKFVRDYLVACRNNPSMAMKDNLINIERDRQGMDLFGGCTGFGCGAAFNFVSLLANGEVHACRKFPSPIGHLQEQRLDEIYYGAAAEAYRRGSSACTDCHLRPVCGGCPAVSYGCGLDPLKEKDPGCFLSPAQEHRTGI